MWRLHFTLLAFASAPRAQTGLRLTNSIGVYGLIGLYDVFRACDVTVTRYLDPVVLSDRLVL